MNYDHEHYHKPEKNRPWWKTPYGMAAIFFFVVAGYFLITEHGAHIGSNWIWLILLLCPLMHVFMHGGHNHTDDEEGK
ncbi:DUF2933 domain-containing protein [Paremcibacter congregatus]|uniref:DUF2933 domain-containing protein n=1 Tax=Paremcibacter congregatus TaxID=2043170 RepID=UPI0030EF5470|tara:strand:- start:1504 stop:1737 length:234 start_codon:yes stop_codon:yes gene_type:complete